MFSIYFLTFSVVHSFQQMAPFTLFSCCPNSFSSSLPASLKALLQSHQNFFLNSQLLTTWTHCQFSTELPTCLCSNFFPPSPSNSQIQHLGILVFLLNAAMIALSQNYSVLFCSPNGTFHSQDYSPHCCLQSKSLKNSYGPSSTKNT